MLAEKRRSCLAAPRVAHVGVGRAAFTPASCERERQQEAERLQLQTTVIPAQLPSLFGLLIPPTWQHSFDFRQHSSS